MEVIKTQNETAPDWYKFKEFSASLSNKLNSKYWKTSKQKTNTNISF